MLTVKSNAVTQQGTIVHESLVVDEALEDGRPVFMAKNRRVTRYRHSCNRNRDRSHEKMRETLHFHE